MSLAPQLVTIDAPVVAVTVMEDRATVTRRALFNVEPGAIQCRISDVSPVLVDKSVAAALRGESDSNPAPPGLAIVDVMVRRRWVEPTDSSGSASDGEAAELQLQQRAAIHAFKAIDDKHLRLNHLQASLEAIATETLEDIGNDVAWGKLEDATLESLDSLEKRIAEVNAKLVRVSAERRDASDALERLSNRLALVASGPRQMRGSIQVDMTATTPAQVTLVVVYTVPCAVWRPYHVAKTDVEGRQLTWQTDACVWQRTGEDWTNIALSLSTERASLGTTAPTLSTDVLAVRRKSDTVVVAAREQTIDALESPQSVGQSQASAQNLPGIDDAGEAQVLRAPTPATIPSDGMPHRIPIGGFEAEAETVLELAAELAPAVLRVSRQVNSQSTPILAGPVDLIMASGYVGRAATKFVAPGERFALGWGPDADLRVHRSARRVGLESKILSSWIGRTHTIKLRLSNLGSTSKTVKVMERVPVSELPDKVKIEVDAALTTEKAAPNDDGMVVWNSEIVARGQAELTLTYRLQHHKDVTGV